MVSMSLWMAGQIFYFVFRERILRFIEIVEAEWHLHSLKRQKVEKRLKKERGEAKVPTVQAEEVSRTDVDCPLQWSIKYHGEDHPKKYETIDITDYQLLE